MPTKTIKSDTRGSAGFSVGSESARMHGNKSNYVMSDQLGTYISGRVSFLSQPQHIRVGGMWTFNNAFSLMIPSTLGTPMPVLTINPPVRMLQQVMKEAASMMSLFGMMQSAAVGS